MLSVHEVMLKQSNQKRDYLLAVTSLRSKVFCIHMLVLKKQGLEVLYLTHIVRMADAVTLGIMRITSLTNNYTNGVLRSCFMIHMK